MMWMCPHTLVRSTDWSPLRLRGRTAPGTSDARKRKRKRSGEIAITTQRRSVVTNAAASMPTTSRTLASRDHQIDHQCVSGGDVTATSAASNATAPLTVWQWHAPPYRREELQAPVLAATCFRPPGATRWRRWAFSVSVGTYCRRTVTMAITRLPSDGGRPRNRRRRRRDVVCSVVIRLRYLPPPHDWPVASLPRNRTVDAAAFTTTECLGLIYV